MLSIDKVFELTEDSNGFNRMLGIDEFYFDEEDRLCMEFIPGKEHTNPGGAVHGGYLFTLCDVASGCYIRCKGYDIVTLNTSIEYYRPAIPGHKLTVRAMPRKTGRTVSTMLVEILNEEGKLVVDAVSTMYGQQTAEPVEYKKGK